MQNITWSPVLAALGEPERRRLLGASATRELRRGSYLALAGEDPPSVHLVQQGLVKLVAADERGLEVTLALLAAGDLIGELAAVDEADQDADALAVTDVRATTFDLSTFTDIVARNPRAMLELARAAARRSRALVHLTLENATASVAERLAGRLLDLAEVLGTRKGMTIHMEMPFNQTDLGSLTGVSRETTCKTMRRFRARGLLDYRGRQMTILRPDLLERLRCGTRNGLRRAAPVSEPSR